MTKLFSTSIRMSEEEFGVLRDFAFANSTNVTNLVTKAALAMTRKLGAAPRPAPSNTKGAQKGRTPVAAQLTTHDVEALGNFQKYNSAATLEDAACAAIRVGLEHLGYLRFPEHTYPCEEVGLERECNASKPPDAHPVVDVP